MKDNSHQSLEIELKSALGDEKVLTDFEDRYVYSFKKVFLGNEFVKGERRPFPDIVAKIESDSELDTVENLLSEYSAVALHRDEVLHPPHISGEDELVVLIDYTEPISAPFEDEPFGEEFEGKEVRSWEGESWYRPLKSKSVFSDERVFEGETVSVKCKEHSICKGYCPIGQSVYNDIESWSSKGRLIISRGLICEDIDHSKKVSDIMFSCAACGNCFRPCTDEFEPMFEAFARAKRKIIEDEKGVVPTTIRDALESTFKLGNPWQGSRRQRMSWADDLDFEVNVVEEGDSVDYLFFVGCTPSYDERTEEVAKNLMDLFVNHLDLDVGVLGNKEKCCGSNQRVLGEEGLFEMLVEDNSELFDSIDYGNLITYSPHCYDVFKNKYPEYGVKLKPTGYLELLHEKISDDEIVFSEEDGEEKIVTYHDSCYLARHNDITFEPRNILESIPNLKFVDIESGTLCCGGGARTWYEDTQVSQRAAVPVVERALSEGAEVLAAACPFCILNFEDAVKSMNVEDKLEVRDIAELVRQEVSA